MPTISQTPTTVLIVCDTDPDSFDEVAERAKAAMPIFAKQPGFVSASLHLSENKNRLIQYLQWETVEDHVACQTADDWKAPEATAFWQLVEEGKMKVDPQIYTIERIEK